MENLQVISGVSPATAKYTAIEILRQPTVNEEISVFKRDTVSLGEPVSPYELYSLNSVKSAPDASTAFSFGLSTEEISARLKEVKAEGKAADYTGKSDSEIYDEIIKRYENAFGEDFRKHFALKISSAEYTPVIGNFWTELLTQIGSVDKSAQANRERLYCGKSTTEIQDEIKNKYMTTGIPTLRQTLYVAWEMNEVGVDYGMSGVMSSYASVVGTGRQETIGRWMAALDQPANGSALAEIYNAHKSYNNGSVAIGCGEILSKLFGFRLNENGVLETADEFWNSEYWNK
jgi:hypothetical protein